MDKSREAYDAMMLGEVLAERKRLHALGKPKAIINLEAPWPYDSFLEDYMEACIARNLAHVDESGNVTWRDGWPAFISSYVKDGGHLRFTFREAAQ